MNTPIKSLIFMGTSCLTVLAVQGQIVSDDFNSYATGTNLQTQSSSAWASGTYFGVNASGTGASASQATNVDVAQNLAFGSTTYNTAISAPGVGESLTISMDFQFTSTDFTGGTAQNTITLGFSHTSANSGVQLYGQLQRFADTFWNLRANFTATGQDGVLSSEMGSFAAGGVGTSDWIRMQLTVEKTATTNEFNQTVTLSNLGADGTGTPLSISATTYTAAFTNASLYSASNWYGMMIADRPDDINLTALSYDNFAVIPEPSIASLALSLLGLSLVIARRKSRN